MTDRFRVTNTSRDETLATRCRKASNPVSRALGLMGRRPLELGEGLIIQPCNGVVSFFMRFPIDVLFLDRNGHVIHTVPRMVPWRMSSIVRRSKLVIELPAGTIEQTDTEVGDHIKINQE